LIRKAADFAGQLRGRTTAQKRSRTSAGRLETQYYHYFKRFQG
jgi:hypothetical protein